MKAVKLVFADENLKKLYEDLGKSNESKKTQDQLIKSFKHLKENPFCGIHIPKKLIPSLYAKKYSIENIWKCDLPEGWRLLYSIASDESNVLVVILEWLSHKEYEKRFNY